jgi:hypothetical protein
VLGLDQAEFFFLNQDPIVANDPSVEGRFEQLLG